MQISQRDISVSSEVYDKIREQIVSWLETAPHISGVDTEGLQVMVALLEEHGLVDEVISRLESKGIGGSFKSSATLSDIIQKDKVAKAQALEILTSKTPPPHPNKPETPEFRAIADQVDRWSESCSV